MYDIPFLDDRQKPRNTSFRNSIINLFRKKEQRRNLLLVLKKTPTSLYKNFWTTIKPTASIQEHFLEEFNSSDAIVEFKSKVYSSGQRPRENESEYIYVVKKTCSPSVFRRNGSDPSAHYSRSTSTGSTPTTVKDLVDAVTSMKTSNDPRKCRMVPDYHFYKECPKKSEN